MKFSEFLKEGMPLKGHEYHKKTDAELNGICKDANEAAKAMKGHNPKAEAKYLDQVNDASTVLYYRKKNGGRQLKESDLTESVNFGKMQQEIYDFVIKNTKGIPPDAKSVAKSTDTFWVHEFDDAHTVLDDKNAPDNDKDLYEDEVVDVLWDAIEAVSNKMINYYSDSWNHPPGYKKVQLKVMKRPTDKILLDLANKM